jgi:hypothetical protein
MACFVAIDDGGEFEQVFDYGVLNVSVKDAFAVDVQQREINVIGVGLRLALRYEPVVVHEVEVSRHDVRVVFWEFDDTSLALFPLFLRRCSEESRVSGDDMLLLADQ